MILGITLGNDITWHNYGTGILPAESPDGLPYVRAAPHATQDGTNDRTLLLPPEAFLPENRFLERLEDMEGTLRVRLSKKSYSLGYLVPTGTWPFKDKRRKVHATDWASSLGLFYEPVMPEIEKMYEDFETVLSGLAARVKANGSTFMVVLFPVRIQVLAREWNLAARAYSLDKSKFDLEAPDTRIVLFCARHGIDFVDLRTPFIRFTKRTGKHIFRPLGDMHLNEEGQALAAGQLAERVLSRLDTLTPRQGQRMPDGRRAS